MCRMEKPQSTAGIATRQGTEREYEQRENETNLHQRALNFAIRRVAIAKATTADGVNLVHKDNARLVLARVA